ncbi:MAG TPA: hypothetical protein VET23_15950 [Chitinophagaceae bacterium]|nr:hypothetical protein [Chitinophagaceae bacterium]
MSSFQAQDFLFQRIKELLPPHVSLVDAVAETIHVSSDSAYRRIRGETPLVLDEAKELCRHFKISLDQLLDVKSGSTLFQNVRINIHNYNYETYLGDLLKQVQYISGFNQNEIIYLTKDVPIFHNFYYKPLIAFRYFFWMKSILQKPEFADRDFELNCVSPEIETLSHELLKAYNNVPSTEIWNTECINSVISQIEFYKDSGYFSSSADIKMVYESLEETFLHLKNQAEYGCKFMPEENPQTKKNNFRFFYNRVVLGDNTIMVITDQVKTVFLNYDVLNYMVTRDEAFCRPCYDDLQNLMKKSTLISQTSEKQRNIFFGIMLSKIGDRKRNLLT